MSTPSPAEVIAEALAKHVPNLRSECDECGANVHQPRMLAAHQASVIAALPDIAIVPKTQHPYFVWEQGYQASMDDGIANLYRFSADRVHTSNPHSLGDPVPDRDGGES